MSRVSALLVATGLIVQAGCSQTVRVHAQVTDAKTERPVANATVTVHTFVDSWRERRKPVLEKIPPVAEATTNAQGVFLVTYKMPSFYMGYIEGPVVAVLRVKHDGYDEFSAKDRRIARLPKTGPEVGVFRKRRLSVIALTPRQ